MAYFIKTIETDVMSRKMFENRIWAALVGSGCIEYGALERFTKLGGEYVVIPKRNKIQDLTHMDHTSGSALTFTRMSTTDDKAVVVRDASANSYKKHDELLSGDNIMVGISGDYGEKVAKRLVKQTCNVLTGAIQAIDTPSANCHVKDLGNAALTAQAIRQGKYLMGDAADELRIMLLHSKVFSDLLRDTSVTYSSLESVSGTSVITGKVPGMFGLDAFIVSDQVYTTNTGTGSTGDDRYHTYLLGANAIQIGWQKNPLVETDEDITQPSTLVRAKITADYIVHLAGVAWASTANPDDSGLYTASNWNEAYEDHREVPACLIISNGGVYS